LGVPRLGVVVAHAIRIKRRGRRPIREHTTHADLVRQYVEQVVYHAVTVGRALDSLVVPAAAAGEWAGALHRPCYDVEPGGAGRLRVAGRHDLALVVERDQHPGWRREDLHAGLGKLMHVRLPGRRIGVVKVLVLIAAVEIHGLSAERRLVLDPVAHADQLAVLGEGYVAFQHARAAAAS